MKTLLEFATDELMTDLLVKERAKCRRRNRSDKKHRLDKDCPLDSLNTRKMLSRMMPPRYTWVRPSKKIRLRNGAMDTSKNAGKALKLTIRRDRALQRQGNEFFYLDQLDSFIRKIRVRLESDYLTFESPRLIPIFKSKEQMPDGTFTVTCRPLSVYSNLEDKIILAVASKYLTKYFDKYLHENILSYRKARTFRGQNYHVTDFNDGIKLIKEFRETHINDTIYAADCDIKKFYDTIPHSKVQDCFEKLLEESPLGDNGKQQVMRVIDAYLRSYNFYTNAWLEAQNHKEVYAKIQKKLHDVQKKNKYQLGWVDELLENPTERLQRGISQGGSLSLLIANIVLNNVDQEVIQYEDDQRLFIRYCDDMILLHTNYDECCALMSKYAKVLEDHGLYYHPFKDVDKSILQDEQARFHFRKRKALNPHLQFWKAKSHYPFLWGDGDGNCNRYIGFLGYEIRRDGRMRLRKDNIKRFKEKFDRLYYALRRFKQKHTEEEFTEHQQKVFKNVLNGVDFYTAFDLQRLKNGSQFRYLQKLKEITEKRLR